jgi:hypothetical protein
VLRLPSIRVLSSTLATHFLLLVWQSLQATQCRQRMAIMYVCAATPISSLSLLHRLILIWCINQSLNQSIKTEDAIGSALLRIRRYTAFDVFCLLQTLSDLYDALSALSSPLSKGEVQCNRDASFLGSLRLIVIDSLAAVISPILGGKANGMYAQ